jgi:hypothetical protein
MLAHGCAVQNGVTGTVDPGDNLVAPDLALDENVFYCQIEPLVIQKYGCATGATGEQGRCHDSKSALRLMASQDPPPCDAAGRVTGTLPDAYAANLEAVRYFVQSDPLTSPFYLRPINLASHPRQIFSDADPAAKLIEGWISAGAH